ncbi:MAG: hypothetical protein QOG67_2400 [Verrucomicrobiota bacterium]
MQSFSCLSGEESRGPDRLSQSGELGLDFCLIVSQEGLLCLDFFDKGDKFFLVGGIGRLRRQW